MLPMFIGIGIGAVLFIILFVFVALYLIRQNKSIIERAKKIDPTVKTITEANYVLQKDLAQNFGNNKKE